MSDSTAWAAPDDNEPRPPSGGPPPSAAHTTPPAPSFPPAGPQAPVPPPMMPGPGWWQASDGNWYPPQQAPGWQAGPGAYGYGYARPVNNGMAIASMVLGIVWLYWIGSVLALVFGYIARRQIDESNGTQTGRGMATAGIVLGWIGVGFFTLFVLIAIAGSTA